VVGTRLTFFFVAMDQQLEQNDVKHRFLGQLLTVPDKPGRPTPMACKKYLLRGVAIPKDIVYVCRQAEPDLIDLDDAPPPSDQWWRLAYAAKDAEPVKADVSTGGACERHKG
jgi:hypothetical protein